MRCCERILRLLLLLFAAALAQAAEISLKNPQLAAIEDGYALSADFSITFNPRLEQVVNKGVVLYFVADFELSRSRWYWFDDQITRRSRSFQLSYHALTRQYRLSTGGLHQAYATLDEALGMMSRLRGWQVIEKREVRSDQTYEAGLRLRLDLTQMPKTFQVSALSSRDWNLASEWQRWNFTPQDAPAASAGNLVPEGAATIGGGLASPAAAPAPGLVAPAITEAPVATTPPSPAATPSLAPAAGEAR